MNQFVAEDANHSSTVIPPANEIKIKQIKAVLAHQFNNFRRVIKPEDIVQPQKGSERTSRILVEGFEGVGKSTLLSYLTYLWEQNDKHMSRFKLLFLIDLKKVSSDLGDTLLNQCLEPGGYTQSANDVSKLIEDNQEVSMQN